MPCKEAYKIPLLSVSLEEHSHKHNQSINMASTILISFISIVLLCITSTQGRKSLYTTNNEFSASSLATNDDGVCSTPVKIQGYTCEEHKVN